MLSLALFIAGFTGAGNTITVRAQKMQPVSIQSLQLYGRLQRVAGNQYQMVWDQRDRKIWNSQNTRCRVRRLRIPALQNLRLSPVIRRVQEKGQSVAKVFVNTNRESVASMPAQLVLSCQSMQLSRVPLPAILSPYGSETYVLLVNNGKVKKHPVEPWRREGESVLTMTQFPANSELITQGLHKIVPGDAVEVIR